MEETQSKNELAEAWCGHSVFYIIVAVIIVTIILMVTP